MLSTREAAQRLGISPRRVIALIQQGDLEAERIGREWLIDEASVERRLSSPRLRGRPVMGQKNLLNLRECMLMNGNHEVLEFIYDDERKRLEITAVHDARYLPMGGGRCAARPSDPLAAGTPNKHALLQWLEHRYMPPLRPEAAALMRAAGVTSTDALMFGSMGLNLSDRFWFRPKGTELDWHDVNFFENGYEFDPREPMRTPDSSTPGALPKRWERINGNNVLLKGASTAEVREPYNELLATRLLQRLLDPCEFVTYWLDERGGQVLSACGSMCDARTEFISANEVVAGALGRGVSSDLYRDYAAACTRLGVADIRTSLAKMIVCDHLMSNFDRHLANFGLLRDAETHEGLCVAPLFDNGAGFFSRATLRELQARRYTYVCNPFSEYPGRQLAMVEDMSWFEPEMLDGFNDEIGEVLGANENLPDEFVEATVEQVGHNIERVLDLKAELG